MQNFEQLTDGKPTAIRLFIADLPETTDAMIPGGVYAMIAETPPARFPVVSASMAGAVAAGIAATLLVPSSPKVFVERLRQVGFAGIEDALDTGRVQVFQFQDDFSKKMFRFGAEAFLSELDHFRLPAQSYLVIDQADELLSLHDISLALEQAEALGSWARKLKVTVLLVFTRLAAVPSSVATLTGLMDYLSGIVRLGGHQDGLDLVFEYWQSPDGTVAAKAFGLSILDSGRYRVKPRDAVALVADDGNADTGAVAQAEPDEAPGDLIYLYIDSQLAAVGQQVAGHWKACDSVVSIIRAAFGTRAPCVLLVYERQTQLRELSEAVHTLRLSLGRRARIVVIERDASLRYQNEILLLRLGTSLVVHRDVPENRIPLMLESIRGQVFNREVEMDFEAALSSVVTSAKRGYLPPAAFSREITSIVDRAEMLNLPCAMVVASPAGGKACTEVLTQVHVHRAGDMASTDGERCFLFFSGCPQSSVATALQTVTSERSDLFAGLDIHVSRNDIRRQLTLLSESTQGKNFPDTLVEWTPPEPMRLAEPQAVIDVSPEVVMAVPVADVTPTPEPQTPAVEEADKFNEEPIEPIELVDTLDAQPTVAPHHEEWHVETNTLSRNVPKPKPLRRAVRRFADNSTRPNTEGETRE